MHLLVIDVVLPFPLWVLTLGIPVPLLYSWVIICYGFLWGDVVPHFQNEFVKFVCSVLFLQILWYKVSIFPWWSHSHEHFIIGLMQQLYQKALSIKSAIPHPRIMGIIRECGGKMHMAERQWAEAATDFFEAICVPLSISAGNGCTGFNQQLRLFPNRLTASVAIGL